MDCFGVGNPRRGFPSAAMGGIRASGVGLFSLARGCVRRNAEGRKDDKAEPIVSAPLCRFNLYPVPNRSRRSWVIIFFSRRDT